MRLPGPPDDRAVGVTDDSSIRKWWIPTPLWGSVLAYARCGGQLSLVGDRLAEHEVLEQEIVGVHLETFRGFPGRPSAQHREALVHGLPLSSVVVGGHSPARPVDRCRYDRMA